MSNISKAFANGKAFIPFITCGDPDTDTTYRAVLEAVAKGADLIELGIPFSDPTAEGPVIQSANVRALSGGITTDDVFALVEKLREDVTIPLVFMTYANVVFSYGPDRFMQRCAGVGIDGIIIPDIPYEEKEEFEPYCKACGVDLISMIAPTSEGRIKEIASQASGFIYLVSSLGVTGERTSFASGLEEIVNTIREVTDVPCAIGFGISNPDQAKAMADISDGAIVGSAIIKILASDGRDAPEKIGEFVKSMKDAIRA
ncbi:MAG: tryptophan synthase subunit alpha [Clostridiales bacterium]|nr:tryptophan synthase subunit alpha [Clostridiales bacterium]